ncbi:MULTISPECIES: antirepressor AbbA [Bacillaceae]|jgi:hypothetical protein|uniref:Antirepressor AbbA n=1 Tax=Ectobacillus funiculus TaxID=137993 RepID=A0ABV5WN68_9BACI|nr:antirepressor AbbA [Ectobacillus funiculus]
MEKEKMRLTEEDQSLLLKILFKQRYASELLSCELADIESDLKDSDHVHYLQVARLFDRLRNADM